ncbi:MAG: glycosyltransferase family 4 protein [Ruminococcaceae bacterium]|nr:glycosyltransferase family 4 protein [Oscillospiraceae bacterium]
MTILYVTTVSSTMNAFFKQHIEMLVKDGHRVELACNDDNWPIDSFYNVLNCKFYHIDFSRFPLSLDNMKAYKQLKQVIEKGKYDIVHCHTPNASVITRLVCRKYRKKDGVKVFYTAHGFHFYKGAPLKNWLLYYPIEKICSYFTDKLITINTEDFELAKRKFKAKEIHYVPGVGVDLSRFENIQIDRVQKRREIGVPENAFLLLSVGELNENKNHQVIIRALAKLKDSNVHYAIAGTGDKKEFLLRLAKELGVTDQIHLLGYRNDVPELNYASDVFCFPSHREGLGLSAIEAMACGLPIVTSNIHGINDYSVDGVTGYKCRPDDVDGFMKAIQIIQSNGKKHMGDHNKVCSGKYSINRIVEKMKAIYEG